MKDFFDEERLFEEEYTPNDDAIDRDMNRSRYSLEDALEYDKKFINKILNKDTLDDADRENIAAVIRQLMYSYLNTATISKEFEEFTIQVMGEEWYHNMTSKWLQRKGNEMAKKWNCPELYNGKGIYIMKPEE